MNLNLRRNWIVKSLQNGTCILLAGLLAVGSPVMAGEPVEIRSSDVALNAGGLLKGTVLNTAGQPVAGVAVSILHNEKTVASVLSNETGEFAVKGLRNGAHVVKVGTTQQIVRLWGLNSAPPAAVENIAIVVDEAAVRGQLFGGGGGGFGGGGLSGGGLAALGLLGVVTAVSLGTTLDNNADPVSP